VIRFYILCNLLILFCSVCLATDTNATGASPPVFDQKELIGVLYFNQLFGQLHLTPSRYSTTLTAVACGHPVKIYQLKKQGLPGMTIFNNDWNYASVGPYEGYIGAEFLSKEKPDCFQDRYPKFFDSFELDISEIYYWGRLYDLYLHGKSKVK